MDKLIDFLSSNKFKFSTDEPLSAHTSFKIGGPAAVFVEAESVDALKLIFEFVQNEKLKYLVIGKGSNLLVSDDGFSGVVIHLSGDFSMIKSLNESTIRAGAGASLMSLCSYALEKSLSGLEFAYGIPGSVGGAVFMNAGAYGGEIRDVVSSVTSMTKDGLIKTYSSDELDLSYRHSVFEENNEIILFAEFLLSSAERQSIKEKMDLLLSKRKEKQPLEYPSAGSTFKRPEGFFAGALIENSGLKGFSVGGAQVSEKHAGFVINKGNASCKDVLAVIEHCQKTVKTRFDVELQTEVRIVD